MQRITALTTFDNPFNPFDQFDDWYLFDIEKGYCSCGYLDRIARTSSALSEEENLAEIERAIDEIVRIDPFNIYYKVVKEIEEPKYDLKDLTT